MSHAAQTFQHAVAQLHRGLPDDAERLCREILAGDGEHCDALNLLGFIALQRAEAARAIELIGQSLALNPRQPAAHSNLANALLQQGEAALALASCERALSLRPDSPEALNNKGTALLQLQRPAEALASYEHALRAKPDAALSHNNRANALQQLGRHEEALAGYQRALLLQPGLAEALLGSARALESLARPQQALASLEEASRQRPQAATIHHEQANLLLRLGHVQQALAAYERAAVIAPQDADLAYNRATALVALGRLEAALAAYERAASLRAPFAKAHLGCGRVLHRLQRYRDSLGSYTQALQQQPACPEALCGMSDALRELGCVDEALASADQALRLDPDLIAALRSRARSLLALRRPGEAAESFARIMQLAGDDLPDYVPGMLLHARLQCCDWRDYESLSRAVAAGVRDGKRVTLPSLLVVTCVSPELQLRCARRFADDNWPALASMDGAGPRSEHARIRLAYVSADFREHPVAQLLAPLIERHDRARFELVGISLRPAHDSELGRRIRSAFDRCIDVSGRSDADVVALLRELEVDIAVDLNGYTDGFRAGIFARRAAPVQVSFLGYPGTLGAACYDYLIADRTVIPAEHQSCYTEAIAYLPDCYQPSAGRPAGGRTPGRAECALPEEGFVFCCFNNTHKILPPTFEVWMRLLGAVPGSVLWLASEQPAVIANLRREAQARGIAAERLVFAPRVPELRAHLARYPLADLFLDTLPFNAHTTAGDALWAGLPVLTCRGESFAGRVAASLLTTLDMRELVTADPAAYESLALRLATTPSLLASLRERLRGADAALFDGARYRAGLEWAYRHMWQCAQQGTRAQSFAVPRQT